MFSPNLPSTAGGQENESINGNLSQNPSLPTSELNQNRFEEHLFSPASPASAPLHRSRIEQLLFSPAAEAGQYRIEDYLFPSYLLSCAQLQLSQVDELPFSPPSPGAMPLRRRFHSSQPLPRFFDELHTERSYLLDCLQIENRKATELLWSIPPLEEMLVQNDENSVERRYVKKRLGWLRHRLTETNRQEKRILGRLGLLAFEVQTRERWTQVEFERRQREVELYTGLFGMQQRPLNPESPAFQPMGYQVPDTPPASETWQQWQSRDGQKGCEGNYQPTTYASCSQSLELATDRSPSSEMSPGNTTTRPGLSREPSKSPRSHLMQRSSSLNDAAGGLKIFSTNTTFAYAHKDKRLSLSSLPCI